jgi:hypothetical protein
LGYFWSCNCMEEDISGKEKKGKKGKRKKKRWEKRKR